jgi:hypothetical protein
VTKKLNFFPRKFNDARSGRWRSALPLQLGFWKFIGVWRLGIEAFFQLVTRHSTLVTFNLCRNEPFRLYASAGFFLGADAWDLGVGSAGVHGTAYAGAVRNMATGSEDRVGRVVALGNFGPGDRVAFGSVSARAGETAHQPPGASDRMRRGRFVI